jgi:hypothetical protein
MSYELKSYSISAIAAHMEQHYPAPSKSNNSISYAEIATKYIDLTVNALVNADSIPGSNQLYVWKNAIAQNLTHKYNGENYWYTWLYSNYPLFATITNGSKGGPTPSLVSSYVGEDELLLYMYANRSRIAQRLATPQGNVVDTAIDTDSLSNFIDNEVVLHRRERDPSERERHKKNIARGCQILSRAELNGGVLRQQVSDSEWPRHYLSGINLQNNTKSEVRDAALGRCYKYDINSSAFAFKATVIEEYCRNNGIDYQPTAMRQLLADKRGVRNMLAYDVFKSTQTTEEHKLAMIKDCITSLGFGATFGTHGAINNIIWHAEDRSRFETHSWIQQFQVEQDLFSEIVRRTYDKKWVKANMPAALKGTRYSQSKLEAYLYAQFETELMTQIQHAIGADNVLLWVHDCVYTRVRIDLDYFNRVPEQMGYPMIRFGCERVEPVRYNRLQRLEIGLEKVSHSQRIAQEQHRADQYVVRNTVLDLDTTTAQIFANRVNIPIANVEIETAWEEYNADVLRQFNPVY